jgi:1,2-diacylglycerol 3-beta-glucosyltransferase
MTQFFTLVTKSAAVLILCAVAYAAYVVTQSRKRLPAPLPPPDDMLFVFMVPCLNEEEVIGRTVNRLMSLPGPEKAILVIDDGSEDSTPDVVRAAGADDPNVWLLQRKLPNARKGKGAALNNAYQYLLDSDLLDGRRIEDVVVAVVDADGRPDANALVEVAPFFRDPKVGACQIGVRMYNRSENFLARMQDIEFVVFTEMFQKSRNRSGSAGLGGNGQFTRLTALMTLGDEPWTDYLTEDLDLGLRMLVQGWHNTFCPTTFVNQQAVTDFKRLVRQRTRWFQGQLQCWNRIPMLLRSPLPFRVIMDLIYALLGAMIMVLMSLFTIFFTIVTVILAARSYKYGSLAWTVGGPKQVLSAYVFGFALSWTYAYLYWLREPSRKFWRILVDTHIFTFYVYFWLVSGLRAIGRILTKQNGWAKTARSKDTPTDAAPAAPTPTPVGTPAVA